MWTQVQKYKILPSVRSLYNSNTVLEGESCVSSKVYTVSWTETIIIYVYLIYR